MTRIYRWTATISPDNKDFQLSLDLFGNSKLSVLESTTGGPKQAYFCGWGSEPVFLCPPPCDSGGDRSITKVFVDDSKGIAIMPVRKSQNWFWAMGEVAVAWLDFLAGAPIFCNPDGSVQVTQEPYRIVPFDAYGQQSVPQTPVAVPNPADKRTHTFPSPDSCDSMENNPPSENKSCPDCPESISYYSENDSESDALHADSEDKRKENQSRMNRRPRRLHRISSKKTRKVCSSEMGSASESEQTPGPETSTEESDSDGGTGCAAHKSGRHKTFDSVMRPAVCAIKALGSQKTTYVCRQCVHPVSYEDKKSLQARAKGEPGFVIGLRVTDTCCCQQGEFCPRCMAVSHIRELQSQVRTSQHNVSPVEEKEHRVAQGLQQFQRWVCAL